jgi:hypothetical protein
VQKITVTISKDCSIQYQVDGVKGRKCRDLTKAIDQLSEKVLEDKVTGEFCEEDPRERLRTGE